MHVYMGAEIYTSIYNVYIHTVHWYWNYTCVCLSVYIYIYYQYVYSLYVYVRVCVCVGVCVQIYFCMGLSLCTNILRANVSKRAGPFGTLGSPHVSASSKPSKLSTASSCFFFCLQIHWLITWRMDGQRMDVMDESHWIDVKRISNICILLLHFYCQ